MREYDLSAWLDGELTAEEQELIEQELAQNPERMAEVADLIREQVLIAETLTELAAQQEMLDCPECEAAEPDVQMLPNEEIFTAYVDGQLSEAETREVEAQIESDPIFKRELAEFCRQRYQLAEILDKQVAETTKPTQSAAATLKFPAARNRPTLLASAQKPGVPWLKIAAIFAILAVGGWFLAQQYLTDPNGDRPQTASVELEASLNETQGEVVVLRDTKRLQPHPSFQLMSGDLIQTGSGQTTVRYEDGTAFKIRSYSEARFSEENGAKQILLTRGLASAEVTRQADGKPLTVSTPQLEITVLGTAFLLEASESQTMLEMTEGSVSVDHLATSQTAKASAGQWLTAGPGGFTGTGNKPRVVSFSLIDTDTKQPVPGYDPISPNAVIPLSLAQNRPLTIQANTMPKIMEEVTLKLVGPYGYPGAKQTENYYPYLVTTNMTRSHWVDAKIYQPLPELKAGSYTITARAETSDRRTDSLSLEFKVQP
ncbi:MAG: FecR domain-containing protein [Akkermansiaceae bacterium]|nr:FecR domain-containing protein [Akkermansiaceae bacterium]